MGIKIEKIAIKNCGPINNFSRELEDLTLIFSENEKGKSYLVEFIIHCLFKNKSYWNQLRQPGQGKVILSGLENSSIEFTPSKRKKLEDYFQKEQRGLPTSLANLLIIKAGKTEINKDNGIDKVTIKEILSPRRILDEIDNDKNISVTIKKAKIEGNEILIEKRGEGETYSKIREEINQIENLINQVINEYEESELRALAIRKEELLQKKQLLLKAKKHEAYEISEKIKELKEKIKKTPENAIENLKSLLNDYEKSKYSFNKIEREIQTIKSNLLKLFNSFEREKIEYKSEILSEKIGEIENKLNKLSEIELEHLSNILNKYRDKLLEKKEKLRILDEMRENSKDYPWLKSAKEYYSKILSLPMDINKKISLLPYIALLFIVISLIFLLHNQKIIGLLGISISILAAFYYFSKLKNSFVNYKHMNELKEIEKEFFNRFGNKLENILQIEEKLNEQEKFFYVKETYEKELLKLNEEISAIHSLIEEKLKLLGFDQVEEKYWYEKLNDLRNQRNWLNQLYQELQSNLKAIENKEIEKQQIEKEMQDLKKNIRQIFINLKGIEIHENEWKYHIEELERENKLIVNEIRRLEGILEGFGVWEKEYEKEDPAVKFSQRELDEVEREIEEVENKIKEKNEKITSLKSKIVQLTGADFSSSWNELFEKIYLKRKELQIAIEECEAKIIAGILIHNKIQELQRQEEEKILEKINSPLITNLIYKLTGRYKTLSFEKEDVLIADEYFTFKINELSTGAKQQVMIALRIGFAKSLLQGNTAFLIFDDAFQYSDYKRRPIMIDTLLELAKEGWQVIYLTMDNHIRDLFIQKASTMPLQYSIITL